MTLQEIFKGESKNVEFKVELPKKSDKYIKTIIAFANSSGGKLIIGIDDERQIVGVDEKSVFSIMDTVANAVSDSCVPQIIPDISFETINDRCIVIVQIYPGFNRPYYLKSVGKHNGTFIRVSATSRVADDIKLKELEMEGSHLSWDEMTCLGYNVTDAAVNKLCMDMKKHMIEAAPSEAKMSVPDINKEQLLNWKILKLAEGELLATNAFALLTGDYIAFAKIQCALFKGIDRDIFIDKKEFSGPIYEQIESAYQFVLRHINLGAEIEGLVRKERYELPVSAIREMIVNAVCHRNYMDNSCVQVAIFDNRVEVTSPGMLYGGLTLEEALMGRSKIRNKTIADAFSRMEIIEEWGTGIRRIRTRAKEFGLPAPEFLEVGETFRVNLYRLPLKKPAVQKPWIVTEDSSTYGDYSKVYEYEADKEPIKADKYSNTVDKEPIKADKYSSEADKEPIKANKYTSKADNNLIKADKTIKAVREELILSYIKIHGSISNREARELMKLSESTTKRFLRTMVSEGLLHEQGERKSRRYY